MSTDIDLTDRQIDILLGVRDKKTIPRMTEQLGVRSYKTVQDVLDELYEYGLIEKIVNESGNTKMRGRQLTGLGKEWLKDHGYKVNVK